MTLLPTDVPTAGASADMPAASAPGLIARARGILLQPRVEWDRIAIEEGSVRGLYLTYVLPLSLAAAVLVFLGSSLFSGFMGGWLTLAGAEAAFVLVSMPIGIALIARVIDALGPAFGAKADARQAHKLAVYSATALMLASVFWFDRPLSWLSIVGLYTYGLLYIGLPRLMKPPAESRMTYFMTVTVVSVVVMLVVAAGVQSMVGWGAPLYFR